MLTKQIPEGMKDLRSHPHRYIWAFISLMGIVLSGITIDINVPSLPAIATFFGVERSLSQLTVTAYLLGYGIFQILSGSVCDAFGRKKPFLIAISAYIVVSLLASFSQDIYQLLGLRFLQGVAVAFCVVSMRAVIPDLFKGLAFKRVVNYMPMAWAMGPIIGPVIGGYLQHYFNWPGPFYFLTVYGGLLLFLVWFFMPETMSLANPFTFKTMRNNFRAMLTHKGYLLCMVYTGLLYSMLILFGLVCPFLMQHDLGYSPIDVGYAALLMGFSWFFGNLTNRFLIQVSLNIKVTVCLWLMLIVACTMLVFSFYIRINIYNIVIPIFLLGYLGAIIFPNYYGRSMSLFPTMLGLANALMASGMILVVALVSGFASMLKSSTQIPLSLTYVGLVVICLGIYYSFGGVKALEES